MPLTPLLIINLTPDSFSDGGRVFSYKDLNKRIQILIDKGVKAFDFGACSTAPMNQIISKEEELHRFDCLFKPLLPWLNEQEGLTLSFDTFYSENMEYFLSLVGTDNIIWNDVSGVLENQDLKLLSKYPKLQYVFNFTALEKKEYIANHRSYTYEKSDIATKFLDSVENVKSLFKRHSLVNNLIIDPGIGFSKTAHQDLELIKKLRDGQILFKDSDLLIGISRKSFLSKFHGDSLDKKTSLYYREMAHVKLLSEFLNSRLSNNILWRLHDEDLFNYAKELCSALNRI